MASSVSSEHTFSQGRITISKRWTCLKGDIVEALQCVKCAIQHDLLFHEMAPSSIVEAKWEKDTDGGLDDKEDGMDEKGWDELLIEEDDEALATDDDNCESD